MGRFDDGDLPPELSYVADQLRSHRYEAGPLELDQARTRILKRAGGHRAARGGRMRKRSLLTAVIMFAGIGTGTAGALAVGGVVSVPLVGGGSQTSHPARSHQNASITQYGAFPTTTTVSCRPSVVRSNRSSRCTALVSDVTTPTGTVRFRGAGKSKSCTLTRVSASSASCSVTFKAKGKKKKSRTIRVTARYSGDRTHKPSSGSGSFTVKKTGKKTGKKGQGQQQQGQHGPKA